MKLAIMQPYFFPYIGYWQLIYAVDRFVIYDDVNYIKGGWINRNRILIEGEPAYITVPLHQASSFKRICDTTLQPSSSWRNKRVKMIEMTYRRAPNFAAVFPVIEWLIRYETDSLTDYLVHQLQSLSAFMDIKTEFVTTSRCYQNSGLSGQQRILDICLREVATDYINPQGGQDLYESNAFRRRGIDLHFLIMHPVPYPQRSSTAFVPYLSIIDALMELGPIQIRQHLEAFDLIETTP
jgi:hypothetical protein